MAAPRKYPDELRDPSGGRGAHKRVGAVAGLGASAKHRSDVIRAIERLQERIPR